MPPACSDPQIRELSDCTFWHFCTRLQWGFHTGSPKLNRLIPPFLSPIVLFLHPPVASANLCSTAGHKFRHSQCVYSVPDLVFFTLSQRPFSCSLGNAGGAPLYHKYKYCVFFKSFFPIITLYILNNSQIQARDLNLWVKIKVKSLSPMAGLMSASGSDPDIPTYNLSNTLARFFPRARHLRKQPGFHNTVIILTAITLNWNAMRSSATSQFCSSIVQVARFCRSEGSALTSCEVSLRAQLERLS